jgi:hypothetical protein
VKDNGHLNQRPQLYAANKSGGERDGIFKSPAKENPGPGSYEINTSGFVENPMFKAMSKKGSFNQSPSPRNQTLNQAFMMNPTLAPSGTNNRSMSHQDSGSYHPG